MGGVGGEAALGGHHGVNAPKQAIERLHQRLHFGGYILQDHWLQRLGLAPAQGLAQLAQGCQPVAHCPPQQQRQQGQGQQQRQQNALQDSPQDVIAGVGLLAYKDLYIALAAPGRKHAPGLVVRQPNS